MTTVTLIGAQAVNGALTSPGVDIPAGLTGLITFNVNIDAPDISDPSKTLNFEVDESPDGGATWQFNVGFTWQGNMLDKTGAACSPWCQINMGSHSIASQRRAEPASAPRGKTSVPIISKARTMGTAPA